MRRFLIAVFAFLLYSTVSANAQSSYDVVTIPTLPGLIGGDARAINAQGQVAGNTDSSTQYSGHALRWDATSGAIDLGTLYGGQSVGYGINDSGHVVGYSNGGRYGHRAFLWRDTNNNGLSDPGEMIDLLRKDQTYAYGINNAGQVVGVYTGSTKGPLPFLWFNGSWNYLPGLTKSGTGTAYAVNNSGVIAGSATASNGTVRAVLWSGGQISALPVLTGCTRSEALCINSLGEAAGYCTVGGTDHAVLWRNGGVVDLNLGFSGRAYGVNASGQMVGGRSGVTGYKAWVWDSVNGVRDLNALLAPLSGNGWQIVVPRAINDNGQIACVGNLNGEAPRACVLNPLY